MTILSHGDIYRCYLKHIRALRCGAWTCRALRYRARGVGVLLPSERREGLIYSVHAVLVRIARREALGHNVRAEARSQNGQRDSHYEEWGSVVFPGNRSLRLSLRMGSQSGRPFFKWDIARTLKYILSATENNDLPSWHNPIILQHSTVLVGERGNCSRFWPCGGDEIFGKWALLCVSIDLRDQACMALSKIGIRLGMWIVVDYPGNTSLTLVDEVLKQAIKASADHWGGMISGSKALVATRAFLPGLESEPQSDGQIRLIG